MRQQANATNFVDLYVDSILRAIVGLVVLGLFFLRRGEREYLWFAAIQLFGGADDVLNLVFRIGSLLPIQLYDLMDATFAAGFWVAGLYFFAVIFAARRDAWFRFALVTAVLSPLVTPLYWFGLISVPAAGLITSIMVLPSLVWVMRTVAIRAMRRNADALMLVVPVFLVDGFYLVDNVALATYQLGWRHTGPADLMGWHFQAYPFDFGWYTVFNIILLVALLAFLIRRFSLARRKEEHLQAQIEAARQVQEILVPNASTSTPGFRVDSVYLPAETVGGDFFQQLQDGEGRLVLVAGDVAGKGLPAAMMVSMLIGAVRTAAGLTSDPVELLATLNQRMLERGHGGFATCLVARIAPDGRTEIANAGHLPPWKNGGVVDVPGSLPLGIVPEMDASAVVFDLSPGDRLTFVSDGVIEAQNQSGELFGFDRTEQISGHSAARIAATAQAFGQEDDITVVTVELSGEAAAVPA